MKPRRGVGFTAAERAGAIASRKGSATVTPAPFKKVRRDSALFVMNMTVSPTAHFFSSGTGRFLRRPERVMRTYIYSVPRIEQFPVLLEHHNIADSFRRHTSTA